MDFTAFVHWVTDEHGLNQAVARKQSAFNNKTPFLQKDWFCDLDGNQLVDFMGKFEHLQADFNTACQQAGLPEYTLPLLNRGPGADYREQYTEETAAKVGTYFAGDIEAFDYTF